jgi:hypothetical protein
MKLSLLILLFLCNFFNVYANNDTSSDLKKEIKNWNIILKEILPPEIININIVTEDDIIIYKGYGRDDSSSNTIYEMNLEAYKNKHALSFIKGDFNKNGKEDIAFSCIDNNKSSYLIIIEKDDKGYKLLEHIKFQPQIFFINFSRSYADKLAILFQAGTDWVWYVYWDGKKFVVEEDDW